MMLKLNAVHYPIVEDVTIKKEISLNILDNNESYLNLEKRFLKQYAYLDLMTFSFDKNGFLSLLLYLQERGTIAISLGETSALINAGKWFEKLGFSIVWIPLIKEGFINLDVIAQEKIDFLFISSYCMDTFVKINLEQIQKVTEAKLISNGSVEFDKNSDAVYFDPYKLTGFNTSGVCIHNGIFEKEFIGYKDTISVYTLFSALQNVQKSIKIKPIFLNKLQKICGEDIYFFVDPQSTLDWTLHFALKGIKARELIRTLSLDEILITNGEGCSLGLSQPSQVLQEMGYDEDKSRNGISLSFSEEIDESTIEKACQLLYKKYKQIKVLS